MSGQTRRSACTVEEEARADRTVQMILVLAAIVTFLGVDGMGHAVVAAYPAVGHVSTGKTAFHQEIAFPKERIEHSFDSRNSLLYKVDTENSPSYKVTLFLVIRARGNSFSSL
ncbi:lachesin-like [Vespula maculifrons]|uniref:Uncharacterized protein n=2 Tax=Vespula TaxID=7451 RepID=A0A834NCN3_VESPE|nr:hypothetical protein H0235_014799 [Vespula pensylvanica]